MAAVAVSVVVVRREAGEVSQLTEDEHNTLTSAIQSMERKVTGELIVVVTEASDGYRYIPTLWAAIAALVLTAVAILMLDSADKVRIYSLQVTLFFGLLWLFQWEPIRRLIVPAAIMQERAARFAREQFFAQRMHHTTERCGAMIFISQLEHHVEILVDKGLSDKVDNAYWQQVIQSMTPLLKQRKTAAACELAIAAVAEMMEQYAKRNQELPKDNELPDHVIEL